MAKITIVGDAVVVTSAMKLEDLETIQKYRPEALTLKGGEDGKEELFRVAVTRTGNNINCNGAEFSAATHDDSGLACITSLYIGREDGDIKDVVADQYGRAVMLLNQLEGTLPAVLEAINIEKAAVLSNITVA